MSKSEIPIRHICSTCDEVVTDPHVHNVWALSHPRLIEQSPTTGLSLEPATFAVLVYGCWVDMGMTAAYYPTRPYYPPVGLS